MEWFHHHTKQVLSLAQLQGGSLVGNPAASVTDEPSGFVTMTSTVPGSRQGGFVTRIPLRSRTGTSTPNVRRTPGLKPVPKTSV
jgi:hypothetical protein